MREPEREREIYEEAIDILVRLAGQPAPSDVPPYDDEAMTREVLLFTDWYGPALGLDLDPASFLASWREAWGGLLGVVAENPVLVLRDYHADNLMVLRGGGLGLLDFQDALAGHPAYDLVSLLQDARRDVSAELEEAMLERYGDRANVADRALFRAHYEVLGAQRNVKILGIFTRLWKRDGKPAYVGMHPRIWGYVERNFAHPALAPVKAWFDAHVGPEHRADACLRKLAA
jgi:N-acetylmuramate 1-kinase